jgi:hypothetical protein
VSRGVYAAVQIATDEGPVECVTASVILDRLAPDVSRETLRNWRRARSGDRAPLLCPVTDPAGVPVRVSGEYVYAWPQVVQAEHATRTERRGRPRKTANPCIPGPEWAN